jgi:hypothetical protein
MISLRTDIDRTQAEQIAELVNLVYAESERGLWLDRGGYCLSWIVMA